MRSMNNKLEFLESEAMKLSAAGRAAFAQLLLASLDEDGEIEEAWAIETERWMVEFENGTTQAIPFADALAEGSRSLEMILVRI